MKAALRTFAMLWLGPALVLLAGLPPLLRTGQVDMRSWMWPALILIPFALLLTLKRRSLHAIWAGLGGLGTILIFVMLAGVTFPAMNAVGWLGLVILLAVMAGLFFARRSWLGLILCASALLSCWLAREKPLEASPSPRPTLAAISALPLFWREGKVGMDARADAPLVTVLRQFFDVKPVDSPLSPALAGMRRLLLAHPRALAPAELVALDHWVRQGGRLLLLADPLLRWPSSVPLGDRRRPPAISMMGSLLDHWGVELLPPASAGEERRILDDGRLLTTMGSSRFVLRPDSACVAGSGGFIARCLIGKGRVVLVADADLIDDRLWLADAAAPLDVLQWSSDTPAVVVEALGGRAVAARNWVQSGDALVVALRWALLGGIFWAILGCVALGRFAALAEDGMSGSNHRWKD